MKVRDEYGKSKFEAVRSLIVYRNKQGQTLCTLNTVKDGKVLPGSAVDGGKLAGLFRMIGTIADPADSMKMVWQDPRILAIGANSILWYAAPHRAEIFFSCLTKALMRCSGKIFPYPGLVFLARKKYAAGLRGEIPAESENPAVSCSAVEYQQRGGMSAVGNPERRITQH